MIHTQRLTKVTALFLILAMLIVLHCKAFIAPINIFRPTDKFLIPPKWPCTWLQPQISYEGTTKVRGFQDDDEDDNKRFDERKVNVLQLWQCEQDALAMLKGSDPASALGQLSQRFTINDDNGNHGIFVPCGDFKVPVNLMFATRFHFNYDASLGFFLPYYVMELSNVRFRQKTNNSTFEDILGQDLLKTASELACLDLNGWKRQGIGDLLIQGRWARDFPQAKPLLTNACPEVRLGLNIPTGKKQDEDKLIAFPFGTDGAWAVQLAGGLNLTFNCYLRGGIDVEFVYLFGNTRLRRIKTDPAQTDLLFPVKVPAFKEFGLVQQYNIYIKTGNFLPYTSFRLDYQHLKHNEDRLFVCSDKFDPLVIDSAQRLQDWTTNSFIFSLDYDPSCSCSDSYFKPFVTAWYKLGFVGKRALLANTAGISLSLSF